MRFLVQTYKQTSSWNEGDLFIKSVAVSKEEAHEKDLLHLSAHLLIIDKDNRVLTRKRLLDDFRYADLWTTTIGTHVLLGHDYLSTLTPLLPIQKDLKYIGEFRVHDKWENEVNGLYVLDANENDLPTDFLVDKKFFNVEELGRIIKENKTTPHLKAAVARLAAPAN